jgi:hypothetical protein
VKCRERKQEKTPIIKIQLNNLMSYGVNILFFIFIFLTFIVSSDFYIFHGKNKVSN